MKWLVCVLLILGAAASADAQNRRTLLETHRDWHVYSHPSGTFVAETMNDSGAVFGVVCSARQPTCYWAVISNSRCRNGESYPVLVNSASGSFGTDGYCFGEGESYTMQLMEFDALHSAINSGSRIGFAIPLESGLFHVTRFNLNGAIRATQRAAELAAKAGENRTGDLVL